MTRKINLSIIVLMISMFLFAGCALAARPTHVTILCGHYSTDPRRRGVVTSLEFKRPKREQATFKHSGRPIRTYKIEKIVIDNGYITVGKGSEYMHKIAKNICGKFADDSRTNYFEISARYIRFFGWHFNTIRRYINDGNEWKKATHRPGSGGSIF